jgi:5-bromo-4-chloroindolyl phosphate hydrolysis protein
MRQRGPNTKFGRTLQSNTRRFIGSGYWTGISFIAASVTGLVVLMEMRTGPFIAGALGLALYGFMAYVIPQRTRVRTVETQITTNQTSQSDDPRVTLLVEAHQHVESLSDAGGQLPSHLTSLVEKLASDGDAITQAVTTDPSKLGPIMRFFTYYLPATSDLVDDRLKLADHAGAARLAEIDATLARLGDAFGAFRAAVLGCELQSVDLDISLLDDALDADLEDLKTK